MLEFRNITIEQHHSIVIFLTFHRKLTAGLRMSMYTLIMNMGHMKEREKNIQHTVIDFRNINKRSNSQQNTV